MKKFYWLLTFSLIFKVLFSQNISIPLNSNWQFRQQGLKPWHKASVPGNVFTDLLTNKLILDPFYSDNEKQLQWIEKENWDYSCDFTCDQKMLNYKFVELEFEGLDTYAKVYINDSLVLQADNMFRTCRCEVKRFLKSGKNNLLIKFESASEKGKTKAALLQYTLPEGERVFTRKAQFHYGWDFGPRFVGCGIWKSVSLGFRNQIKINSVHCEIKSLTEQLAQVAVVFETFCDSVSSYRLETQVSNSQKKAGQDITFSKDVDLEKGVNFDTILISLKEPKLWWCNGLGEPSLYNVVCAIFLKDKKLDEETIQLGLRTIELVQEMDSLGLSFYFKLNGLPVFAKGANLIPSNIFVGKEMKDVELVRQAKACGMNMLRVWGGGVYPSDDFYQSCDQNGILVWQDLMFACAMYPGDQIFINSVTEEIKDQFKRIRIHPSLAVICGNNESDEGWNNWGWQKQFKYSYQDSLVVWNDYQKLFHALIPQLCSEFLSGTPYHYSSPGIGWGRLESLTQSDSHYWGVWWGMEPFGMYRNKVGRFASEYGFQSLPDLKTLHAFCPQEQFQLNSPAIQSHQKHKKGFETIKTYMQKDYAIPDSLAQFAYVSQLLQRDGMKIAIEAHRSAKPKCMGTLFWQFNDCWPAISWSAVDYFGRPKAMYYSLRQNYAKLMLAAVLKTKQIELSLISDSLNTVQGEIQLQLKNFKGKILWKENIPTLVSYSSAVHYTIKRDQMPDFDSSATYLQVKFMADEKCLASNRLFFASPKHLKLSKAKIYFEKQSNQTLAVSSDVFAKDVYLYSDKDELNILDNYFDLEPGIKKVVQLVPGKPFPQLSDIRVIVLNNL